MTQDRVPEFELPRKMEKVLAALSVYYKQQGKSILQRLLVNSPYHVYEEWCYDGWDGGTYGHAIYFQVPAPIYYEIIDNLSDVAQELREKINGISNVQGECITEVFLELQDDPTLENWRENSGTLTHAKPATIITSEDQLLKLWKPGFLRLFLSHKAEYKELATQFKEAMDSYGVSCFVAHEDIRPTKEWQNEIEKALFSMEVLVALMTKSFSDSPWTDQEIGVAIGRGVPTVPVRLGIDPYGFIGKYQALSGANKSAKVLAKEVYELLWGKSALKPRLIDSLVTRLETSNNFGDANFLINYLERIETTSPIIIDRLEKAFKENRQVREAFKVQRKLPDLLKRLRRGKDAVS